MVNMAWIVPACVAIAAIGIVVDAAEMIAARQEIADRFAWPVIRTSLGPLGSSRPAMAIMDAVSLPGAAMIFQIVRAAAAIGAVAGWAIGSIPVGVGCALVVIAAQIVGTARLGYGLDGADQMQTLVWAGIALCGWVPAAGLTLIASQSLLSYLIAGIAKIAGHEWRSGEAPGQIAATIGHGNPWAAKLLARWTRPVAAATIGFEVVGPLLVLAGPAPAILFVAAAATFHLSIAAAMGLNNFVWSFTAALPAVLWLSTQLPWA